MQDRRRNTKRIQELPSSRRLRRIKAALASPFQGLTPAVVPRRCGALRHSKVCPRPLGFLREPMGALGGPRNLDKPAVGFRCRREFPFVSVGCVRQWCVLGGWCLLGLYFWWRWRCDCLGAVFLERLRGCVCYVATPLAVSRCCSST